MLATNKLLMWLVNKTGKEINFFSWMKKVEKRVVFFFSVIKVMFFYKGKCFIVIKLTFSDLKKNYI